MINRATFRFYEELNDFLPLERRKQSYEYPFKGHPAVKDAIEAQGVPHTEVDLIIVDGNAGRNVAVDFGYQLHNGDRVAVYPVFESFDIGETSPLRPVPLRQQLYKKEPQIRFVLDVHLGKLARLLRLMGFDTYYANDQSDAEIAMRAKVEHRIVLTRDQGLLKRSIVQRGYWVRSLHPEEQAGEVVRRFDLRRLLRPFSRCPACNGTLKEISPNEVDARVPAKARRYATQFAVCESCGKVYWPGSHRPRIEETINRILEE